MVGLGVVGAGGFASLAVEHYRKIAGVSIVAIHDIDPERAERPGSGLEEQVRCTVRYRDHLWVDTYHGFHQPQALDRMWTSLAFERGEMRLSGWVPTVVEIYALVDDQVSARLTEPFGPRDIEVIEDFGGVASMHGRHKALSANRRVVLRSGDAAQKMSRYGELLVALLVDLLAWRGQHSPWTPDGGVAGNEREGAP